jgi:hypothetical protein
MKNLLQLLVNLFSWFMISFQSFWGILWYGKLPKISIYHWMQYGPLYKTKDIFEDENIQIFNEKQVPLHIKERIINSYINELFDNESFKSNVTGLDIPLFDGKKVYGSTGINSILHEVKRQYLKN